MRCQQLSPVILQADNRNISLVLGFAFAVLSEIHVAASDTALSQEWLKLIRKISPKPLVCVALSTMVYLCHPQL